VEDIVKLTFDFRKKKEAYYRHFKVSKLFPKVFYGVYTDKGSDEETDHLYTGSSQYRDSKRAGS
jgi:hypothetical protein